jgi:hypothetical protein
MKLDGSVTNTSQIISITISEAHNTPSSTAVIIAASTTLDIGDEILVTIGYVGDTAQIFKGWVKGIEKSAMDNVYTIQANDEMIKAVDFFIASSNPTTPFSRSNIAAEDLVQDVLELAQITAYSSDTTFFTFGIHNPIEVNLVSAHDFCNQIADILAYSLWADRTGTANFKDRRPYVMGGDTSIKSINDTEIIKVTHRRSDRDLRNRIVVYGASDLSATAEAESPYLPTGYRRTVVVGSQWIDDQGMAQNAADYNLDKLNRLTEELAVEAVGDTIYEARKVITVVDTYTGVSGDWYIYSCEHRWGSDGYSVSMELRK